MPLPLTRVEVDFRKNEIIFKIGYICYLGRIFRFIVGKGGKGLVFFDPKKALEKAKERGNSITVCFIAERKHEIYYSFLKLQNFEEEFIGGK